MADTAHTPNVLTRTAAEFAALDELATELVNPAYIEAEFATLGQRYHGPIQGRFVQLFMAEVQAALVGGTVPGPATPAKATVSTTDATPTQIASVSVADGESVTIDADVWGKKAAGDWVHVHLRAQYERADGGNGLQVLDLEIDTGPRYSADTTLSTASADLVIDGNTVDIRGTGEAATSIDWTTFYTVRRVA